MPIEQVDPNNWTILEQEIEQLASCHKSEWARNYIKYHKARCVHDAVRASELSGGELCVNVGGAPYIFDHAYKCLNPGADLVTIDIDPSRHQDVIDQLGIKTVKANVETDLEMFSRVVADAKLVVMCEIFEHMRIDLFGTFSTLFESLKPNAVIYLTTPNLYFLPRIRRYLLEGRSGPPVTSEWKKLADLGHMGHVREYTRNELREFFEDIGFTLRECHYRNSAPVPRQGRRFVNKMAHATDKFVTRRIPVFAQEIVMVLAKET